MRFFRIQTTIYLLVFSLFFAVEAQNTANTQAAPQKTPALSADAKSPHGSPNTKVPPTVNPGATKPAITPGASNKPLVTLKDTVTQNRNLLLEQLEEILDDHPSNDIYNNVWRSDRVNPYRIPVDSLPDSVRIDMSKFVIPHRGVVTSRFGPRRYRFHYGIDLKVNVGDSILSSFDGKVRIIDYEAKGYGHYVVIRHENGLETVYAHFSQVLVEHDQAVKAGELIGLGGNTGRSTGPHLHYELRYLGNAINPENMINFSTGLAITDEYLLTRKKSFRHMADVKAMQAARYVTVRKGDTLGAIAARNGTSINNICRLNNISRNKVLRIGQKLRVR
jgi:murein DD-endopeptidase MepM/ murein hydrolase activator NlpD